MLLTLLCCYRISALGIVGDLLKKVGALELKLVGFALLFIDILTFFYVSGVV